MKKKLADVVPIRSRTPAASTADPWSWQMPPALREAVASRDARRIRWAVYHMLADATRALGELTPAGNGRDRELYEFCLALEPLLADAVTARAGALRSARAALNPEYSAASPTMRAVNLLVAAWIAAAYDEAKAGDKIDHRANAFTFYLERRDSALARISKEDRDELIASSRPRRSMKRITPILKRLGLGGVLPSSLETSVKRAIRRLSRPSA